MELILAPIGSRHIPTEWCLTLPLVIICLYVVFRWRKFGEDAVTWNHEYFTAACSIGFVVWSTAMLASLLPELWQVAVFWLVGFIVAVVSLTYWAYQELLNAAILSLLIVVVGVVSMPVPLYLRQFLFGPP